MIDKSSDTFFSVLVPVLNEARHIERCLVSLLSQIPEGGGELLMIDGGSDDGTLLIVERLARNHPILKIVPNPGRLQSIGCNMGARIADPQSTALVRADAHAFYPPDFLRLCVSALRAEGATSVVVPMKTRGETPVQRAIAAAQNSLLGNGGSRHRRLGASGYVDHGHHAAFDRRFFEQVGGYDPSFSHNEDAELDVRAKAAGGQIWLCTEAAIEYFPRSTFPALARQYRRHGAGRARTLLKHRQRPKLRQLVPLGVLGAGALGIVGFWSPPLMLPLLIYLGLCTAWSLMLASRHRDAALLSVGLAAIVMHVSWSVGFLHTCMQLVTSLRSDPKSSRHVRSLFTGLR